MDELCRGFPGEFEKYMNYCRSLNFEDKPCISDLRRLFKNLLVKKSYEYDFLFDWVSSRNTLRHIRSGGDDDDNDEVDFKEKLKAALK